MVFLLKSKRLHKKLTKSGQINIAETVVSATIILVLAISVAQLGSRVALSNQTSPTDSTQKKVQNVLDLGLSLGYLRVLVYNNSNLQAKNSMNSLIVTSLPSSALFSLLSRPANGTTNQILLGLTPVPSGNLNIVSASVFINGYYDSVQSYTQPYVVTLIVAIGSS